jgi:outer membrane lipopolysaccharide assembly protein LptE/RlpB
MYRLRASAPLRFIILLGLTLTFSACGFQPRGQVPAPAATLLPLAITGIDHDTPLYIALQHRLGKDLSADAGQAAAVLTISAVHSGRELLTVDARNKANEYQLVESLVFRIRQGGRESAPQTLSAQRIHYAPGTAVLAHNREEAELRQAMREQLADQLLQRLAAWH